MKSQCDRCLQPLEVGTDSQLVDNPLKDSEGNYVTDKKLVLWRCPRCLEEFIE